MRDRLRTPAPQSCSRRSRRAVRQRGAWRGALADGPAAAGRFGRLVESGRRPCPACCGGIRRPLRQSRHPQHRGPGRDEGASVFRADRPERPRVRHVPSAGQRDERLGRGDPGAMARHAGRIRSSLRSTAATAPICRRTIPRRIPCCSSAGCFACLLPWPPQTHDGAPIEPEFTIEVVRDPSGCNTSPVYGLKSPTPRVSVYRRPRPAANLKYVIADGFGVSTFIIKNGQPAARDPETGKPLQMNMMSDAREVTLKGQAISAAITHLETDGRAERRTARPDRGVRASDLRGAELSP